MGTDHGEERCKQRKTQHLWLAWQCELSTELKILDFFLPISHNNHVDTGNSTSEKLRVNDGGHQSDNLANSTSRNLQFAKNPLSNHSTYFDIPIDEVVGSHASKLDEKLFQDGNHLLNRSNAKHDTEPPCKIVKTSAKLPPMVGNTNTPVKQFKFKSIKKTSQVNSPSSLLHLNTVQFNNRMVPGNVNNNNFKLQPANPSSNSTTQYASKISETPPQARSRPAIQTGILTNLNSRQFSGHSAGKHGMRNSNNPLQRISSGLDKCTQEYPLGMLDSKKVNSQALSKPLYENNTQTVANHNVTNDDAPKPNVSNTKTGTGYTTPVHQSSKPRFTAANSQFAAARKLMTPHPVRTSQFTKSPSTPSTFRSLQSDTSVNTLKTSYPAVSSSGSSKSAAGASTSGVQQQIHISSAETRQAFGRPTTPHTPLLTSRIAQLCQKSGGKITPQSKMRRFPGPAGLLPKLIPGQTLTDVHVPEEIKTDIVEESGVLETSTSNYYGVNEFNKGAWMNMKCDMGLDEKDPHSILAQSNIAVIMRKASLKQLPKGKIPHLCVLIKSVDYNDATAVFRDSSGEIHGTIHRKLLEDYQNCNASLVMSQSDISQQLKTDAKHNDTVNTCQKNINSANHVPSSSSMPDSLPGPRSVSPSGGVTKLTSVQKINTNNNEIDKHGCTNVVLAVPEKCDSKVNMSSFQADNLDALLEGIEDELFADF
uniref:Agglutinin-like protein 6-like n=1 Tax=Saccoglossus kowalevskii TaxID=10224 RepID=A0ABM0GMC7_SACKO|nr:PREDICTED: agglutinin-like protein 6-like [Saccoglossus kowalevskii]